MKDCYQIKKPSDFKEVINDFLENSNRDRGVIALSGDLGAGKTAFTQELGKCLGVTEKIISPTFTIMKSYPLERQRFANLIHIDAYRLEDENEAKPLCLNEVFGKGNNIICVEWPERIRSFLPSHTYWFEIEINSDQSRTVTVKSPAEK